MLGEADTSHQSVNTWKERHDPQLEKKRRRIGRLTHRSHRRPVVLSVDEIGPILLPPHGGVGWFRADHPARIPSTYTRPSGTRYRHLTLNVCHTRLSGRSYRHLGGALWLDHLRRERARHPADQRVYPIQDNLRSHWTPEIRPWARGHRVSRAASATQASWMSPVESHAGDLQRLVPDGSHFGTWTEVRREFPWAITYRNQERFQRLARKRSSQRRWVVPRRPIGKRR